MSIPNGWRLVRHDKRYAFARFKDGTIQEREGSFETIAEANDHVEQRTAVVDEWRWALTDYHIEERRIVRFTEVVA